MSPEKRGNCPNYDFRSSSHTEFYLHILYVLYISCPLLSLQILLSNNRIWNPNGKSFFVRKNPPIWILLVSILLTLESQKSQASATTPTTWHWKDHPTVPCCVRQPLSDSRRMRYQPNRLRSWWLVSNLQSHWITVCPRLQSWIWKTSSSHRIRRGEGLTGSSNGLATERSCDWDEVQVKVAWSFSSPADSKGTLTAVFWIPTGIWNTRDPHSLVYAATLTVPEVVPNETWIVSVFWPDNIVAPAGTSHW